MERAYVSAIADGGAAGPNVEVRASTLAGANRGVFARRRLARGAWITTYHGVVLPAKLVPREDLAYAIDFPVRSDTGAEQSLVGTRSPDGPDGVAQLVNDSIHPDVTGRAHNCDLFFYRARLAWVLIASRDIERDEELFVSYGYGYWRGQWRRHLASHDASAMPDHLAWVGVTAVPIEYLTKTGLATEFTEDIRVEYRDDVRVSFRCRVRVLARCHVPICTTDVPSDAHPERTTQLEVDFVRRARGRDPHEEVLRVRCETCDRPFVRLVKS